LRLLRPSLLALGWLAVCALALPVQAQRTATPSGRFAAGQAHITPTTVDLHSLPSRAARPLADITATEEDEAEPQDPPAFLRDKVRANACAAHLRAGRTPPAELHCVDNGARRVLSTRSSAGAVPETPVLGSNFRGDTRGSHFPPDPTIAVGPSNIVFMTNENFNVYTKGGTPQQGNSLAGFFASATTDLPFDPHVVYDNSTGHFFAIAASRNVALRHSSVVVAVSRTSDAAGTWDFYGLDATLDGNAQTTNWCDFPLIGINDQAVYLTCNMFTFTGNSFVYPKVRVVPKSQFLARTCCTWSDFFDLRDSGGAQSFTVAPAVMRGAVASNGMFLVNSLGVGADFNPVNGIMLRHFTNDAAGQTPTFDEHQITVASYASPPDARQPGTATCTISPQPAACIDTSTHKIRAAAWQDGMLYFVHNVGCGGDACLGYKEIDVRNYPATNVVSDTRIAATGADLYYGAIDANSLGTKALAYTKSSSTEFASVYLIGIPRAGQCINCVDGPETLVHAGNATYVLTGSDTRNRWGDYSGAAADPDGTGVWIHAEFAEPSNSWVTWVQLAQESTPGAAAVAPALNSIVPNTAAAGSGSFTLTLNGSGFTSGSVVLWNGISRSTSFVSSTQLSASIPATDVAALGSALVQVNNAGAISPSATFTINQVPPSIASLVPASAAIGSGGLTLTVNGANFVNASQVLWNGSARTTTFVSDTQLTATIPASDINFAGTFRVTVDNGSGNVSTAQNFSVNAAAGALPNTTVVSYLPHVPFGGGFRTKITLVSIAVNTGVVNLLNQQGQIVGIQNFTSPAGGAVRIDSANFPFLQFGPLTVYWAMVGSSAPIGAHLFFEFNPGDANSPVYNVVNTVGFSNTPLVQDFTIPFEQEAQIPGSQAGKTVGMAIANPSATNVTLTLEVVDSTGLVRGTDSINIGAFGQIIFAFPDIPRFPNITAALNNIVAQQGNFVGTLTVHATTPLSVVALQQDYGPFSSLPTLNFKVR